MTPEQFTTWLDGFLSNKQNKLDKEQTALVKQKLNTVFTKVTPLAVGGTGNSNLIYGGLIPKSPDYSNIQISC